MLGAWACMSGDDEAAIARVGDQGATSFTTNEIVVQCSQQNPYVVVLRTAGARIVEVGDADGTRPEQLDAALGDHTAAVLHVMNSRLGAWRHRSRRGPCPRPRTRDSRNRRRRRATAARFESVGPDRTWRRHRAVQRRQGHARPGRRRTRRRPAAAAAGDGHVRLTAPASRPSPQAQQGGARWHACRGRVAARR